MAGNTVRLCVIQGKNLSYTFELIHKIVSTSLKTLPLVSTQAFLDCKLRLRHISCIMLHGIQLARYKLLHHVGFDVKISP